MSLFNWFKKSTCTSSEICNDSNCQVTHYVRYSERDMTDLQKSLIGTRIQYNASTDEYVLDEHHILGLWHNCNVRLSFATKPSERELKLQRTRVSILNAMGIRACIDESTV